MSQLTEFAGQVVRATPDDLSPEVMQGWISNPEMLRRALRKALVTVFPTWKTITLGTHENIPAIWGAFKEAGYIISESANEMMSKPGFMMADEKTDVELVKVSVGELGLQDGASLVEIYERAWGFRLLPCLPEVGPELCLNHLEQSQGELVFIAMDPIGDSGAYLDGNPSLFCVSDVRAVQRLDSRRIYFGPAWKSKDVFIFERPQVA